MQRYPLKIYIRELHFFILQQSIKFPFKKSSFLTLCPSVYALYLCAIIHAYECELCTLMRQPHQGTRGLTSFITVPLIFRSKNLSLSRKLAVLPWLAVPRSLVILLFVLPIKIQSCTTVASLLSGCSRFELLVRTNYLNFKKIWKER